MRRSARICASVALLLWAICVPYALCVASASREEASAALADARQALRSAFVKASEAETAGANTTVLTEKLLESGSALTGAEAAFGGGNYSDTVSRAAVCKALADSVGEDAVALKGDATAAAAGLWILVALDVVGAVVFLLVLFLVWRWFRRLQRDKLLQSRPEATG